MHWYFEPFKKYAVFSGRARRKEYWMFYLFNIVVFFVLGIIEGVFQIKTQSGQSVLGGIYLLVILVPWLAVSVRRIHDTGRSGWWLLVTLIPFGGAIAYLVFMVQSSQQGTNQYGPNPVGENTVTFSKKNSQLSGADELRELKQLLDEGIITHEDFEKKKNEFIGL